VHKEALSSKC
jgi:hypothetical protein